MKYMFALMLLSLGLNCFAQTGNTITVPLGGNGWVNKGAKANISDNGLSNWSNAADQISVYVSPGQAGGMDISLKLTVPSGASTISVSVGKTVFTKTVNKCDSSLISFGKVQVTAAGYLQVILQGIKREGKVYADVSGLVLGGTAVGAGTAYVKDNHGNYFYWGHRGPSVHLNYPLPDEAKATAEWFYNEVTVPVGNDVLGSYFMADGFTGGYFGMQVNSATERHILFSIWSPFETDNPKSIPDSMKIQLLKKGDKVHTGEFGSEGSGGQSYLNYPWVAGKTYAFLIHAQVDAQAKTTVFTAYFKEKGTQNWLLVASFKRPQSGFYLKGLYSFLENFNPEMGNITRKVMFGEQWLIGTNGKWYPINKAVFTADATANVNYRKDYSGGVTGSQFYLRNCGFFSDFTAMKSTLIKPASAGPHPDINFSTLP